MFSFAKRLVDRFDGSGGADTLNSDPYFKWCLEINNRGYGLRVIKVDPHSPAHQGGIELWFDYVVKINHHELPMKNPQVSNYIYRISEDGTLNYGGDATAEQALAVDFDAINREITEASKRNQAVVFDVWNAKGGVLRQVLLTADDYNQLGMAFQLQHLTSATYVWRILATHALSPAFHAGMVPYSDYIIGCDLTFVEDKDGKGLLTAGGEGLLLRTVFDYYNYHHQRTNQENIPITFYVYNHDYDILRPVTVNLNRGWGGGGNKGMLGCDVGYGLLHRLPEVVGKFKQNSIVDDVLFESNANLGYEENVAAPPPVAPPVVEEKPFLANPVDSSVPPQSAPIPPPPSQPSILNQPQESQTGVAVAEEESSETHIYTAPVVDSQDRYIDNEFSLNSDTAGFPIKADSVIEPLAQPNDTFTENVVEPPVAIAPPTALPIAPPTSTYAEPVYSPPPPPPISVARASASASENLPPSIAPPPPHSRKKTRHTVQSQMDDIFNYMEEESAKSLKLEADNTTAGQSDLSSIPPPPRAH